MTRFTGRVRSRKNCLEFATFYNGRTCLFGTLGAKRIQQCSLRATGTFRATSSFFSAYKYAFRSAGPSTSCPANGSTFSPSTTSSSKVAVHLASKCYFTKGYKFFTPERPANAITNGSSRCFFGALCAWCKRRKESKVARYGASSVVMAMSKNARSSGSFSRCCN